MGLLPEERVGAAADLEDLCVEAAQAGALVLCARARFARRIHHRGRLGRIGAGPGGWPSPGVFGLQRWIRESHGLLWEPVRPLTRPVALRLWRGVAEEVPPPEGLDASPRLFLQLQKAVDLLEAQGLDPAETGGGSLPGWRARAFARFRRACQREGVLSWRGMVTAVARSVAEGRCALPAKVVLAGFDAPTPLEAGLFEALGGPAEVRALRAARTPLPPSTVRVYATPEQECLAVCDEVLREWNAGTRGLAVVFFEPAYGALLGRCFQELAAREPLREGALRYNLAQGTPLAEHPLYRSLLLPLRIADAPDPAPLLADLLNSPYIRPGLRRWRRDTVEVLWSSRPGEAPDRTLDLLCDHGFPLGALKALSRGGTRALEKWLSSLRSLWDDLGVLRFEGEDVRATDALAHQHLTDVLEDLGRGAGDLALRPADLLAWIGACAEGIQVTEKTPETAGIQVLPAAEAKGLAFDRLWAVGCHGRVLPSPSSDLPFLSPAERAALEQTSPQGQWAAAARDLEALAAGSGETRFSRAVQADDDSPYLPCPFLPDEAGPALGGRTFDPWAAPGAWARATWLSGARRGLAVPRDPRELQAVERVDAAPPEELSVSHLQSLMQCPYQYLCAHLAGLEPLPERVAGVDPRRRGEVVHKVFARLAQALGTEQEPWPSGPDATRALLGRVTDAVLDEAAPGWRRSPLWRVERLRLVGREGEPGLLDAWLDAEASRAGEGWRFAGAEASFQELRLPGAGILLRGRVDRVDVHARTGWAVWDYKTGATPSLGAVVKDMAFPQLPAYAAAIDLEEVRGKLWKSAGPLPPAKAPVAAGYIPLRRPGEVAVKALKDGPRSGTDLDFRRFRPEWEEAVRLRLSAPRDGRFPADPVPAVRKPGHPCDLCSFTHLCGRFDAPGLPDEEEDP